MARRGGSRAGRETPFAVSPVANPVDGFDTVCGPGRLRRVLTEIRNVRQERGAGSRRWFQSDGLDLIVWRDADGALAGFQLCYDFGRGEHALTWRASAGFAHSAVDDGDERVGGGKQTPILVAGGEVPWTELTARFAVGGATLERELRDLVAARLAARR